METTTIGYLLAGLTTLAWGTCVIPVKMSKAPGCKGVAFSIIGGLAVLLPFFIFNLLKKQDVFNGVTCQTWLFIVFGGICQFPLATIFYYEAIKSAEISTIVPLKSLKVVIVMALVFLLRIETISIFTVIGSATGIVGAFILVGKSSGAKHSEHLVKGVIMVLLACLFWSIGDILLREAVQKMPSLIVTPAALFTGGGGYYCWLLFSRKLKEVFSIPTHDKICYLVHGIISFGIGYCAFFATMNYIGISRTVVITNAWPLIAFGVGIFLYREKISMRKIIGTIFLIGSIYIVTKG